MNYRVFIGNVWKKYTLLFSAKEHRIDGSSHVCQEVWLPLIYDTYIYWNKLINNISMEFRCERHFRISPSTHIKSNKLFLFNWDRFLLLFVHEQLFLPVEKHKNKLTLFFFVLLLLVVGILYLYMNVWADLIQYSKFCMLQYLIFFSSNKIDRCLATPLQVLLISPTKPSNCMKLMENWKWKHIFYITFHIVFVAKVDIELSLLCVHIIRISNTTLITHWKHRRWWYFGIQCLCLN